MRITKALHDAAGDDMTGCGLLVLPNPDDDMSDPLGGVHGLVAADWAALWRTLSAEGWELTEPGPEPADDSDDDPEGYPSPWLHVGTTRDGRDVVSLMKPDAITSRPTPDEWAEAERALLVLLDAEPLPSV